MKLETKELLKYELKLLPIEDFKTFYKESFKFFNDFSKKAFLKACRIPPGYFLQQPSDLQKELLDSQEVIIEEKLSGKYIVILQKDNMILNCARVDYSEFEDIYERIQLNKNIKFTPVKNFIKEGYISNFISYSDLKNGEYNIGIFVDIPIMCNKLPIIHKGFYYLPNKDEENYKCMYIESKEIDFNNYQTLDLFIEDSIEELKTLKEENIIQGLKDKFLIKDIEEILIKLNEVKVIPKKLVNGINRYITKNEMELPTIFSFIDVILRYDEGINGYKQSLKLRSCVTTINEIIGNLDNGT